MNERVQSNLHALIAPLTVLMTMAMVVCLLAVLAGWLVNLPVQPALAIAQNPAPATTPVPTSGVLIMSATPEPTADPATPEPALAAVEPSPTPAYASICTSTSPLRSHTVQPGDTLGNIAQAYAVSVESLTTANAITDPDVLYAGQVLILPEPSTAPAPASAEVDPTQPSPIPSPLPPSTISEARWIDVNLTEQSLTAYEGSVPVHTTLVSTGLPNTPTPVGQFRIWIKLRYDDMAGPGYYIEDVPYVMYFHGGYGLHGVTWHGNFGHPMSHGCVNLPTSEAEWLFDWAEVGTLVNIHD
jgi:lipoprotein-anchoring transpeptidase ErfK/SrfK